MSWYDLSAGQRAYRLAYLVDAIGHRDGGAQPSQTLIKLLDQHAKRLLDESFYAGHSNHGLFQIAGMLALGRRFGDRRRCRRAGEVGALRLAALLDDQFAPDGIHREHSPGYQAVMVRSLAALSEATLLNDERLRSVIDRAEDALAWFVTPDGTLARIGDTHASPLSSAYDGGAVNTDAIAVRWRRPAMRAAVSAGRIGTAPEPTTQAFTDGGFAVLRSAWPLPGDSTPLGHLTLAAAFHSRTHKHADDLTFTWFDGRPLVVDAGNYGYVGGRVDPESPAGRRGYWYDDPNRMYVESTAAHNAVVIDDDDQDRRRSPYGSGIRAAGHVDGQASWAFTIGSVDQHPVRHHRAIVVAWNRWLLVVDLLDDAAGASHRYEQRFHAAPDLDLRHGDAITLASSVGPVVWATSAAPADITTPVRGEVGPPMRGWHSPEARRMVPAWSFGWAQQAPSAVFATQLSLVGPTVHPAAETIEQGWIKVSLDDGTEPASLIVDFTSRAPMVRRVG